MDRLAKLAICLTLLAAAAWGQTCSCPGCGLAGTNGDIPANVSVTTPYSGDPTKALISWTNTHNEYGIVQLTQQLYGVGSPDVDRIVNGPNSASTAASNLSHTSSKTWSINPIKSIFARWKGKAVF